MPLEDLGQLQKELKLLVKPLDALNKIVLTKPDSLSEIERLLKELPPGETLGQAINEWRAKIKSVLEKINRERREAFNKILADFIRKEQAKNTSVREFDQSWRVGPIEIKLRAVQAQIQMAYNQQPITKWVSIGTCEDIEKLFEEVNRKLCDLTIPFDTLTDVFWSAYDYLWWQQEKQNNPNFDLVPLKNFCQEVHITLIRTLKKMKKATQKEFPLWAFLYNLDIYFSNIAQVPLEKRLGLQTGSQAQTTTMGMVTGGMDALKDYKTYCYVFAATGRK